MGLPRRFHGARTSTTVAVSAFLLFASARGLGQAPLDAEATAAAAALAKANFDASASVLTLYDRQGNFLRTVGDRAVYSWPALSPDGTRVAVQKRREPTQSTDIWVTDLSTGASARLTSDSASVHTSPVWSADGLQIAYASNLGGSPGLYRSAADGSGSAELLYQHPTGLDLTDWSRDGRFMTFHDATNLYLLPLTGPGERRAVTITPVPGRAAGGRFSPDGRFLAYASTQSGQWEIWVRPIESFVADGTTPGAEPRQVSAQGGLCTCAWRQDGRELFYLTPDGHLMAVNVGIAPALTSATPRGLFKGPDAITQNPISKIAISRDGERFLVNVTPKPRGTPFLRQLTVFDRQGNVVRTLGEPLADSTEPSLSPDGTHLATARNDRIQVVNLSTGAAVPITASTPIVRYQGAPVWSPDGRELVSFSQREGWSGFYQQSADGSGSDTLLYKEEFEICLPLTDWSPDGRVLAFGGGGVLWTVPVSGERPASEFLREEFRTMGLRFSPDGRYVAYASEESGRYEVYVRPFVTTTGTDGGEKWQISTTGGLNLIQWRGDGRELYYLAPDGTVMAVDVTTTGPTFRAGPPTPLFRTPATVGALLVGRPLGHPTACGQPGAGCGLDQMGSISRNGQRFAFDVPVAPRAVTLARSVLDRYAGTWRQPGGATRLVGNTVVVTVEDNKLMVLTDYPKDALFALSETAFFQMRGDEYEFVKDKAGDVKYLFVYEGGAPVVLVRQ